MFVVSIILWLRDLLSLAWSLPIIIIFILALRYSLNVDWLMYILMVIILIDSISSTFTVAKLSIRDHTNAGDASSLSKLTFIPSQIWGLIFIVCSLSITIYTFLVIIGFMPVSLSISIKDIRLGTQSAEGYYLRKIRVNSVYISGIIRYSIFGDGVQ